MTAPLPDIDRRRFPIGPALDYMNRHGISPRTMQRAGLNAARAIRRGTINGDQADRLAVMLHMHPCELWGDLWYSESGATTPDPDPVIVECLCGKPHPCPDHGQWAGLPHRPAAARTVLNGFYLLRLMDEADQRGRYRQDRTRHHSEEAG